MPIKLRVTYERKRKYWTINDPDGNPMATKVKSNIDFQQLRAKSHRNKQTREMLNFVGDVESSARNLIKEILSEKGAFTFDLFKELWVGQDKLVNGDTFTALDIYIRQLKKEERFSSLDAYKNTLSSLKKFTGKDRLEFTQITPEWLKKYELWMTNKNGRSITTVGIYLRCLRKIFNDELDRGKLPPPLYPFGKKGYKIPIANNKKKAISKKQISSIITIELKTDNQKFHRDMWIFSYLANGMNPKDIFNLKFRNIRENLIIFQRAKTQKSHPIQIQVFLHPLLKNIIQKWGNKDNSADNYIFPVLNHHMSTEDAFKKIKQTVKNINKTMEGIRIELGIDKPIKTYTARHSYATVQKMAGVPTEAIGESMGHCNSSTTTAYLESLGLDTMEDMSGNLI